MHITKILSLIITMSLLFFACIQEEGENEITVNHIHVNDHVPAFIVKDTTGTDFSSQQFVGKQTLLVFFGTYCSDCQQVLPVIEEVWKELKDTPDFLLAAISREESADDVLEYWEKNQFTMPFYLDTHRDAFSLFANNTIPRIYIINADNVVVWMSVESLPLSAQELVQKIKELE